MHFMHTCQERVVQNLVGPSFLSWGYEVGPLLSSVLTWGDGMFLNLSSFELQPLLERG